jgi:hypothetical protein
MPLPSALKPVAVILPHLHGFCYAYRPGVVRMHGRYVALLVFLLLVVAGIRHGVAQNDPFQQATCQDEFAKLRSEVEKRGLALKSAGERKAQAPEVCKLLRNYTSIEERLMKFLTEKQAACGVPDQVLGQAKEGHARAVEMRNRVCQVAAGPPPPPPSQGLSGALGASPFGGPPPETGGGSGVFDTMTGNILRQ